jgi:hypothetical protein
MSTFKSMHPNGDRHGHPRIHRHEHEHEHGQVHGCGHENCSLDHFKA